MNGSTKQIRIAIGSGIVGHVVCSGEAFSWKMHMTVTSSTLLWTDLQGTERGKSCVHGVTQKGKEQCCGAVRW